MGLFLPFTPNGRATELRAIEVKRLLGLTDAAAVDPLSVLPLIPARLVESKELWEASPDLARRLFLDNGGDWSGMVLGRSPLDGAALILINPAHTHRRRRATLMEEIVHLVLRHPPTAISQGGATRSARTYDPDVEDEAFNVGAACLLPYPELFHAIRDRHESAESIAERTGLSIECVEFRIKRAGLSRFYQKHSVRFQVGASQKSDVASP